MCALIGGQSRQKRSQPLSPYRSVAQVCPMRPRGTQGRRMGQDAPAAIWGFFGTRQWSGVVVGVLWMAIATTARLYTFSARRGNARARAPRCTDRPKGGEGGWAQGVAEEKPAERLKPKMTIAEPNHKPRPERALGRQRTRSHDERTKRALLRGTPDHRATG